MPGDREDVIAAIVHARRVGAEAGGDALGLVLTGGYRPRKPVLEAIRAADLFATIVPEDTYAVASEVHDLLVKTHAADRGKIEEIKALVWEYLFIDRILEVATEAEVRPSPRHGLAGRRAAGQGAPVGAATRAALSPPTPLSRRRFPSSRRGSRCRSAGCVPKRTASDASAGRSTVVSSASVSAVGDRHVLDVGQRLRRQDLEHRRPAAARRRARPPATHRAPPRSARRRTGAAARSSGHRCTLRDDSARPSGSRIVGTGHDLGPDREVAGHLADDHDLLRVLLAEIRAFGTDEVEQDRHDGRHAIEVARAAPRPPAAGRPRRPTPSVAKPGG